MRHAARVTLFVHERDGRIEAMQDLEVLQLLLQQPPLITRHDDGGRTFVFDLVEPDSALRLDPPPPRGLTLEALLAYGAALGRAARALGLPLTAALADSAGLVAEGELRAMQVSKRLQC